MNTRLGNDTGKPLRPSYREHFRPLPPPSAHSTDHVDAPPFSRALSGAPRASFERVHSSSRDGQARAPEGNDSEGRGADRRTSVAMSRMQSSSSISPGHADGGANSDVEPVSRKSSADYASSCSSNARQKPLKSMTKVSYVCARTNTLRPWRALRCLVPKQMRLRA